MEYDRRGRAGRGRPCATLARIAAGSGSRAAPDAAEPESAELVEGEAEVTTKVDFTSDEWDLLVQLPRWVVAAASAAQHDLAYRTHMEMEAGFIASAKGGELGNAFVAEVTADTMRIFDTPATARAIEFRDRTAALVAVLDRVRTANQVLKDKAAIADGMAYRRWLLAITDIVISAAKTGGFLGFGGELVTTSERAFRDRLVLALQS